MKTSKDVFEKVLTSEILKKHILSILPKPICCITDVKSSENQLFCCKGCPHGIVWGHELLSGC